MGLLAAGALGNLFDRVAFGKVTDMFYFRAINFPVFNVADACITIAAGLLIYLWTVEALAKPKPAEPPIDMAS
jgi:signal peptidase II